MKKIITFSKTGTSYITRKLEEIKLAEEKKRSILNILFTTAGAKYDEKRNTFAINDIDDISEDEMLVIYMHKDAIDNLDIPQALQDCNIRTIFPCPQAVGKRLKYRQLSGEETFKNSNVEILKFGNEQTLNNTDETNMLPATGMEGTFYGCSALHTVYPINIKDVNNIGNDTFEGCISLKEIRLYGLAATINIADSPHISYRSLLYAISNCKNNRKSIDFAVSPNIYRYINTISEAPNNIGGTTNEWNILHKNAVNKNIHFITSEFIPFVKEEILCINNINVQDETLEFCNEAITISGETIIFT